MSTVSRPLLLAILGFTASVYSGVASAHFFAESHNCKAPVKPLEFITELDRQEFDAKVKEYRACLEGFVGKQNEAMNKHKQAAENAAAAWKQYAESVLKVKFQEPGAANPAGAESTPPAQ